MSFLFFTALIIFVLYYLGKWTKKGFHRFVLTTDRKRRVWKWMKCISFVILSIILLFATGKRWYYYHDEMLYSGNSKQLNLDYANQVEVEAYLMSQANVIDLFEGKPPSPDKQEILVPPHRIYEQLIPSMSRFYLVLRLKNTGNQSVWGVLNVTTSEGLKMTVDVPPLPPKMTEFKMIVQQSNFGRKGAYPTLDTKWHFLYTPQGEKR